MKINNSLKNDAKESIVDSIRDLCTAKITLPLGNPNLKLLHTNQFLFTELQDELFELENLEIISEALNSSYSRYSGYTINRWYVEGTTITNDGKTAKIDIALNPFASSVFKYHEERKGFENAYNSVIEQLESQKEQSNNSSSGSDEGVKSVPKTIKLKDVKGFSKKDQEYIKKVVTKALNARNNPREPIPVAFAIYEYYNKNHVYSYYTCMKKMKAGGFEKTWKNKKHNCGDGAATLQAMFRCAGFTADIFNGHNHFWVRVVVNGKYYYCDQAGKQGSRNSRILGTKGDNSNVWKGVKGGSKRNSYC